jgi:protein-S-isoprenylcysteine O-methyltransferase Ste14
MARHSLRILAFLIVLVLGVIPSFLFFVWVERNMALPWVGPWLMRVLGPYGTWPLIFVDGNLGAWIAWNLGLIAIFGFLHSAMVSWKTPRAIYIIATGLSTLFIMSLWQPTGIVLYQLIPSAEISTLVSVVIYWTCLIGTGIAVSQFESPFRFVGLVDALPSDVKTEYLQAKGFYTYVRHPVYSLTVFAWLVTPMMSLDRLVFTAGMCGYLYFGIRLEERRLVEKFGDYYRTYQKRVPMIFPRLLRSRR